MASKRYKPRPLAGFFIWLGAVVFALFISNIETFQSLELDFLDYRFRLRGTIDVSESPIVILAIDDQSDASTPNRWPWPRAYFARVIENLNEAGAKVIGVDVIFDQADRHGQASDDALAAVLKEHRNVVLAGKLFYSSGRLESTILVPPHETFTSTGVSWGLVSSEVDRDGIFRRYLAVQKHLDRVFPSFILQVLRLYEDYSPDLPIEDEPDRFVMGAYAIPKFDDYSMLINYAGPAYTFPVYPFDNVLDDAEFDLLDEFDIDAFDDPGDPDLGLPPGLLHSGILKDKIVLIGATMQELHDDFPTPFLETRDEAGQSKKALTPGVEVHANALQTILDGRYLVKWGLWEHVAILLVLGVLMYGITSYLPTVWSLIGSIFMMLLYFSVSLFLFVRSHVIIDMTMPGLLILFCFVGYNLYQYVLSQREKRMIRGAFAQYVPEKVVEEILKDPDKLTLGGEERVVSVIFSDIVGFTPISEKLAPTELVHLLNDYLTAMSEIILANDGIIDKYEGDAIMAEFGVPVPYESHAFMACKTAVEMQRKLDELRKAWMKEEKPQLKSRIGINTGEVIVGNMGSRDVFDYTVIGDAVNLGSRLEGANKFYGTNIMISAFTYDQVKDDFRTRMLDVIRVKGKAEPIQVYELLGFMDDKLDDPIPAMLNAFDKGMALYRSRSWAEAVRCFQRCLELRATDGPSRIYRDRCLAFQTDPPPSDWDGVTDLEEK